MSNPFALALFVRCPKHQRPELLGETDVIRFIEAVCEQNASVVPAPGHALMCPVEFLDAL